LRARRSVHERRSRLPSVQDRRHQAHAEGGLGPALLGLRRGATPVGDHVNPLLDVVQSAAASAAGLNNEARTAMIAMYAFGIPTQSAVDTIRRWSPVGVVEIGAGNGLWAHALHERAVSVEAFDLHPAPSPDNQWFAGARPWHSVTTGDHSVVERFAERTLLIVWPTKNETWASSALKRYHAAGGTCVVYVGERPGGHTGDDMFHALLGEIRTCVHCEFGSLTSACICDVEALWRRAESLDLPHWPGHEDDLNIYTPIRRGNQTSPNPRRREGRR
jgi:hypothetical protein